MIERTWKCRCGKFQARLTGEPMFVVNCHCHSCVASMRHIDAKGDGRNTSAEAAHSNGGVAKAFFHTSNVEFSDPRPAEQLQFLKVGDNGKNVRSYTRCCGTQLNTAGGKSFPADFRPFNRNCITNADGSKYEPDPAGVLNVLKDKAFEPEAVPEPNGGLATFTLLAGFVARVLGYRLLGLGADSDMTEEKKGVYRVHGAEVTEAVPITWE